MLRLRWPFEWVPAPVKLRDLPDAVAVEEVRRYFEATKDSLDFDLVVGVARSLQLPIWQVERVLHILKSAGEIGDV